MKLPVIMEKMWFTMRKNSPEILLVAGIAGGITAAVMACKKTPAAKETVEHAKKQIETLNAEQSEEHAENDVYKEVAQVYVSTTVSLAKLYGPAVCLGIASILSIVSSNNILRKRVAGLAAAYAIVDTNFKEYRKRVVERYGEEADKELRFDVQTEEVVDENGEVQKVQKANISNESDYARLFDECNPCWQKDPSYNLMFIRAQQQYANDRLRQRGYLFLNEVYESLGMDFSEEGQFVGWVYDRKNPTGDNVVDFNIYELNKHNGVSTNKHFEPHFPSFLLDFNVDGCILDNAKKRHLISYRK